MTWKRASILPLRRRSGPSNDVVATVIVEKIRVQALHVFLWSGGYAGESDPGERTIRWIASCPMRKPNPIIPRVEGIPYKAFRRAAAGMLRQAPEKAAKGCPGYARRVERICVGLGNPPLTKGSRTHLAQPAVKTRDRFMPTNGHHHFQDMFGRKDLPTMIMGNGVGPVVDTMTSPPSSASQDGSRLA